MTDKQADGPDGNTEADEFADETRPAAEGILRCLQMLAEEAAALRLPATLEALHHAMAACAVEALEVSDDQGGLIDQERPAAATLH